MMYNNNVCWYYIRRYIIPTNIVIIQESVYRLIRTMYNNNIYFLLYKKIYNDNKHFYDTSKCIFHYTRRFITLTKQ